MKNSLKKILAGISAVAMLTVAVPMTGAFADDEAPADGVADTDTPGDDATDTDGEDTNGEDGEGEDGEDTDGEDEEGNDEDDEDTEKPDIDYSQTVETETEEGTITYVAVDDDNAVITKFESDDKLEITVPEEVDGYKVVGIADFAFATVRDDVVINVPDTLELDYMGSEAFMTSGVIAKATSVGSSVEEIVKYWINQVTDGEYSDSQIKDDVQRAYDKVAGAYVDSATTELIVISIIKDIKAGEIEFSQKNVDRMNMALSLLSYEGVQLVVKSADETPAIKTYADGKVDLECEVTKKSTRLLGDVTGNGELDLNDAIWIARYVASEGTSITFNDEQKAVADYDGRNGIDLNDVIAIAKAVL